jgi:hypothetical protein
VMIGICVALVRDLRRDPLMVRRAYARDRVESAVVQGVTAHGDEFSLAVVHDDTATHLIPITEPVATKQAPGDPAPGDSQD